MIRIAKLVGRILLTALVVAFAIWGAHWLWRHYTEEPWTRDGRVRAEVVLVNSDVNGLITDVLVRNDQVVRRGDVLFVVDRARYRLALDQAEAAIAAEKATLAQAIRKAAAITPLTDLVTTEQTEQGGSKVDQLRAQLQQAIVQRNLARLNLERTMVRATVNGVATNVEVQRGDFASAGHQVIALVNTDSLYVDGYFEETKLPRIQVGDRALVHIMGLEAVLKGQVVGIAAGIADRERMQSPRNLANINPTFSWVRLPQRVPVRVKLDAVPANVRLISGRTATVSVEAPAGRPLEGAAP